MRRPSFGRILVLAAIVALVATALWSGVGEVLTVETLKARRSELTALLDTRPLTVAGLYFLFYVAVAALSIPGAAVMTLAGGAIFGLVAGVILVSFASVLGAVLAFLGSRYLFRDWVKRRFDRRLEAIDRGLEQGGAFYLLSIRLNPIFPYFLVNLAMGLTRMPVLKFAFVSQIGMLPATIVYVNAGTQLARIREVGDILSPGLIGSLILVSLLPLIGKWAAGWLRRRRVYKGWRRPRRFDRNLIVIGAGAGGLVTAYIAAALRAKVTIVEANRMGGDCLNTGCVPSKALIRSARAAHEMRTASRYGLAAQEPQVDFPAVMRRIRDIIREIEPADSVERFTGLGVDVRLGYARILDPWTVEVNGERLTTRSIVIAAGAEPAIPPVPGLSGSGYLTSDTMWEALAERQQLPSRLVILGGGPIGVEMAQAFARLGAAVTIVQAGERILPKEDPDVAAAVAEILRSEGVDIRTGHTPVRCEEGILVVRVAPPHDGEGLGRGGLRHARSERGDSTATQPLEPQVRPSDEPKSGSNPTEGEGSRIAEQALPFDDLIVAVGRKPRLKGYGLEALGIDTEDRPEPNAWLETLFPNIYVVGDVAGSYQFTHAASHQAWHAAVNALFGSFKRFRVDYSVLPWVTFTDPEVAHVGHNEESARAAGIPHEVIRYSLDRLDRAVAESANGGFVKLLVQPGKDRILGVTIVGHNSGELIAEVALAMKQRIGLNKLLGTIHAYPTMAEASRMAAGEWRKSHRPARLLAWIERYHRWRRR